MIRSNRIPVVFSIVGYLLATTAVHALHDHSAHAPHYLAFAAAESVDEGNAAFAEEAGHESQPEHHHGSGPSSCDESCFACRLLAVKCVPSVQLTISPRLTTLGPVEQLVLPSLPCLRPSQPLSRGPPRA